VLDNESTNLTLTLPAQSGEGTAPNGTVAISGTLPAPLTVTLFSGNTGKLSVSANVTIPDRPNVRDIFADICR
jgi:hypothetical protein